MYNIKHSRTYHITPSAYNQYHTEPKTWADNGEATCSSLQNIYSVAKQPKITAPYSFKNRVKYFFSIDRFLKLVDCKNFCPEF